MALPLVFDFYNSIIEVPYPDDSLDMQYLINQIRDTEEELNPGMQYRKIADASGKDDLGGGVYTAITVRLLDNWRIRFQARDGSNGTEQMIISGGNLVGGPGGNPIAPSAYTQVLNLSSAAGTIAVPSIASDTTNLKYLLASMIGTDKTIGNIYYWDPVSGNDGNTGLTPDAAVATFAKAHDDLVTEANHDVIFCLSSDPSGITTVTETLTITKSTLKVKGPGYVFQLKPSSNGSDVITITPDTNPVDSVEISGLYIEPASGGTDNGITVNDADNVLIKDCWIYGATGNGIEISNSTRTRIEKCAIENCTAGNGIAFGASTTKSSISTCIITGCVNGVDLAGSGLTDNILENNIIYNNSGYGIDIGTGVIRTGVRMHHTFSNNTSGNTYDEPPTETKYTFIESAGAVSDQNIIDIVDGVWDEVLTPHTTANSAAKILKDAKLRATLASLK